MQPDPTGEQPPIQNDHYRFGSCSVPFASAWRERGAIEEPGGHPDLSPCLLELDLARRYSPGIFSVIRPTSSPKSKTSIRGGSTPSVVSAVQT